MAFLAHRNFIYSIISVLKYRHLKALYYIFRVIKSPISFLYIYLTGKGDFPRVVIVRTPMGTASINTFNYHDILTVNEVFCRFDYKSDEKDRVIVDVGSNIGVSALYFLTRSASSFCFLYEPNPMCIERMKENLAKFTGRYKLIEAAVSDVDGFVEFGIESTGRYGGIGLSRDSMIKVECRSINSVLNEVLVEYDFVDVLKIDTEGAELRTLMSVKDEYLSRIKRVYIEGIVSEKIHEDLFAQKQYGTIYQLTNRKCS